MHPLSIIGLGSALPDRVVSNAELESLSGFSASRIRDMFEIETRHWSRGVDRPDPPPGQRCSDLAVAAARKALADGGLRPEDLGAVIVVTTTPDYLNPPMDFLVVQGLGLREIPAFSLLAPCTGVFRAVELASAISRHDVEKPILVVVAETPSPFFRFGEGTPTDQVLNSVLYGDGAGALVLSRPADGDAPRIETIDLVLNSETASSGIMFPGMLSAFPPATERYQSFDYLGHHDFRRVLRRGSKLAAVAAIRLVEKLGAGVGDVRFFVTHQATGNIRRIAASYGLPAEKIPINIDHVGNTIGASVLILLDELKNGGAIRRGDLLVLHTAESSTWSSAAMAIRW